MNICIHMNEKCKPNTIDALNTADNNIHSNHVKHFKNTWKQIMQRKISFTFKVKTQSTIIFDIR